MKKQNTSRSIRVVAMDLLSRREHSAYELTQKLKKRDFDIDEIEAALEDCKAKKDNSDNPEEIRTSISVLTTASHKVAEHMYKDTQTAQSASGCSGGSCNNTESHDHEDADTVEAEFEEEPVGK